jgi:hypothetical protein
MLIDAHIIPKFFFRYLYPNEKIEGQSLLLVNSSGGRVLNSRVGPYDKNILCQECDNKIGRFDDYAKKVFIDKWPTVSVNDDKSIILQNIDYEKLKLFFLSLLWRASVSNHDIFSKVSVGPFEGVLRDMIMNNNPGDPLEFPIIITQFSQGDLPKDVGKNIQDPIRERIDNINFVSFYFPKFYKIYIKVDRRDSPIMTKDLVLSNKAVILKRGDYYNSQEFKILLNSI